MIFQSSHLLTHDQTYILTLIYQSFLPLTLTWQVYLGTIEVTKAIDKMSFTVENGKVATTSTMPPTDNNNKVTNESAAVPDRAIDENRNQTSAENNNNAKANKKNDEKKDTIHENGRRFGRFTGVITNKLIEAFERDPFPTPGARRKLSKRFHLPYRSITRWFERRRSKHRDLVKKVNRKQAKTAKADTDEEDTPAEEVPDETHEEESDANDNETEEDITKEKTWRPDLTDADNRLLLSVYQQNPLPDEEWRGKIADFIGISADEVMVWFIEKAAFEAEKAKNKKKKMVPTPSCSKC